MSPVPVSAALPSPPLLPDSAFHFLAARSYHIFQQIATEQTKKWRVNYSEGSSSDLSHKSGRIFFGFTGNKNLRGSLVGQQKGSGDIFANDCNL